MSGLLDRVVCGLDGTPASIESLRQVGHLARDETELLVVTVASNSTAVAAAAGAAGAVFPPPLLEEAEETLALGVDLLGREFPRLGRVETRVLDGPVIPTLLGTLRDERATLAAAGRHRHSRLAGLVVGSVATSLLHDAPCSVLIAGERADEGPFPRSIVVGFDGSEAAEPALATAVELAGQTGASLNALCATRGQKLDVDRIRTRLEELAPGVSLTVAGDSPAQALRSTASDLVVLGTRGLHGVGALGSVSERVAHRAHCSVLVVRDPASGD